MSKLKDCQFIKITIDGKDVAGSSEEKKYINWMEGFAPKGITSYAYDDGAGFESVHLSVLATKDTSTLFEKYLQRGYKNINITTVYRGSDKHNKDYEIQRTVFEDCHFLGMGFHKGEDGLFIDFTFSFTGSVEVTFNVPNAKATGLDKIGPINYGIPEKTHL
ncbi:hypothetical protein [Rahnella inusitata]|uniref:hypothetical protein n=1 Tax=Rahnella inusitata TaxID=58169 RepID=UPI0039B11A4E